jgi:hypothetical protein
MPKSAMLGRHAEEAEVVVHLLHHGPSLRLPCHGSAGGLEDPCELDGEE